MATFDDYDAIRLTTSLYSDDVRLITHTGEIVALYPFFGLAGEVGEVHEKLKKIMRDNDGIINPDVRNALIKELGDILWYLSACSRELGVSLQHVANQNVSKLLSRMERNQLQGSGDNR
jgi:NTP pyrophosphatase (non-canonical NTP hydrolase)